MTNDLVGKRVLVMSKEHSYDREQTVKEIKVLEISPSGQWTRIMNEYGKKIWMKSSGINPIEILANHENHPEKP